MVNRSYVVDVGGQEFDEGEEGAPEFGPVVGWVVVSLNLGYDEVC